MRKIKIVSWIEKNQQTGKDVETDTTSLLDMMVKMQKPESQPKGIDKFRTMNRLVKAFDKAKKTEILELEETDYKFLADEIKDNIPAMWGTIPKANEAIELFMEAKSEENKTEEEK